jgi:glycerol uptake facilitator protein
MLPYLAEFLGTMIMMTLINSVVANATLDKSGMKGCGSIQITLACGFGVMIPCFIFGAASGAHFNPAITLALAIGGMFKWSMVPGYIACQMAGAFAGATIALVLFKDQFDATENPAAKLGVFSTSPAVPDLPRNMLSEIVATFVLVFAILGRTQVPQLDSVMGYALVYMIVADVGMCFGGLTGFALNPARDLGPRLVHAVMPIKGKGSSNFKYGLVVPIWGPIIGAILAVLLFKVIPW